MGVISSTEVSKKPQIRVPYLRKPQSCDVLPQHPLTAISEAFSGRMQPKSLAHSHSESPRCQQAFRTKYVN